MRQRISKKKKELYGNTEENKFDITKYRYSLSYNLLVMGLSSCLNNLLLGLTLLKFKMPRISNNLQLRPAVEDRFNPVRHLELSQDLYVADIHEGEKKTERRDSNNMVNPDSNNKNVTKISTADLISVTQSNQQVTVPQNKPVIPLPISKMNKKEDKAEDTYTKTDTFIENIK